MKVPPPHSLMLGPLPSPYPGVCLLQDQPKAQTQNHQGQLCASLVPQGTAQGGGGSAHKVVQGPAVAASSALASGEGRTGGPVPRVPKAGSGNWVVPREKRRGQPSLVGCSLAYSCYLTPGLSFLICKMGIM